MFTSMFINVHLCLHLCSSDYVHLLCLCSSDYVHLCSFLFTFMFIFVYIYVHQTMFICCVYVHQMFINVQRKYQNYRFCVVVYLDNIHIPYHKNLASEDSRRPLPEVLHESINFQNYSNPYILGPVRSEFFIYELHLILC